MYALDPLGIQTRTGIHMAKSDFEGMTSVESRFMSLREFSNTPKADYEVKGVSDRWRLLAVEGRQWSSDFRDSRLGTGMALSDPCGRRRLLDKIHSCSGVRGPHRYRDRGVLEQISREFIRLA